MDLAVKLGDEERFAQLVAMALAEQVKPLLQQMVDKAVDEAMPGQGLTQGELAKKLRMTVHTAKFEEIAYHSGMPRYEAGNGQSSHRSNSRWYSKAVDKFMDNFQGV